MSGHLTVNDELFKVDKLGIELHEALGVFGETLFKHLMARKYIRGTEKPGDLWAQVRAEPRGGGQGRRKNMSSCRPGVSESPVDRCVGATQHPRWLDQSLTLYATRPWLGQSVGAHRESTCRFVHVYRPGTLASVGPVCSARCAFELAIFLARTLFQSSQKETAQAVSERFVFGIQSAPGRREGGTRREPNPRRRPLLAGSRLPLEAPAFPGPASSALVAPAGGRVRHPHARPNRATDLFATSLGWTSESVRCVFEPPLLAAL